MAPNDGAHHSLPGHSYNTARSLGWATFCGKCKVVVAVDQRTKRNAPKRHSCGTTLNGAAVSRCLDCNAHLVVLTAPGTPAPRCGGNGRHRLRGGFVRRPKADHFEWESG